MLTTLSMLCILAFLAFALLFRAEYHADTAYPFDARSSAAMRGFWSLVVILVHTPARYQNPIQDLAGSFGFVAVTFFFLASGYGLKLSLAGNPKALEFFWQKRLPKLLISMFCVNALNALLTVIREGTAGSAVLIRLLRPDPWVWNLLICYFLLWAVSRFLPASERVCDILVCVGLILLSAVLYAFRVPWYWTVELYGFVWGILLYHLRDRFVTGFGKNWVIQCVLLAVIAGLIGVTYLRFKYVPVYGNYLLKIALGLLLLLLIAALNTHIRLGNHISLFLGGISYEIYLLHTVVYEAMEYYLPEVNSGVFIISCMTVTILLSRGINRICRPAVSAVQRLLIHE